MERARIDVDELVEFWTLLDEDRELLAGKRGVNAFGFALLLKHDSRHCLPCLILLVVGLAARQRTRAWLQRLVTRFGTGTVNRSVPIAVSLLITAVAVGTAPFWLP